MRPEERKKLWGHLRDDHGAVSQGQRIRDGELIALHEKLHREQALRGTATSN